MAVCNYTCVPYHCEYGLGAGQCTFQWCLLATATLGCLPLQRCKSCSTSWEARGRGFLSPEWGTPDQHVIFRHTCPDAEGKKPFSWLHLGGAAWKTLCLGPSAPTLNPAWVSHKYIDLSWEQGFSNSLPTCRTLCERLENNLFARIQWPWDCHLRILPCYFCFSASQMKSVSSLYSSILRQPTELSSRWCKWEMAF